ncbi:MAG: cell division protein SepF [Clostridia bacterium]|nr:cell division protein SepF [Clostridia bacterium]
MSFLDKLFGNSAELDGEDYEDVDSEEFEDEDDEESVERRAPQVAAFKSSNRRQQANLTAVQSATKLIFYKPVSYDDAMNVVLQLRNNRSVIVNIVDLIAEDIEAAQRVHDFLEGAAFALDGKLHKVGEGIYCLTPSNYTAIGYVNPEQK